nr:aspartate--tRNA(Asn) ligase [Nanoarchaeota archaeon]
MKRSYVNEITPEMDGKEVLVKGWVYEIRDLSNVKFVLLRDYTGMIQLVANKKETPEEIFKKIPKISIESVVVVKGIVKKSKIAKKGVEIVIKDVDVLSRAETLPITVSEKGIKIDMSKRLDFRSIDLRKQENQAIFKIQSALTYGMIEWLNKNGFTQVFTPCLMGASSESGAEVFKIKYYNTEAFLRQDPQLHRQLTILGGIEKLYDIGPSWRAEKSNTSKHLCEHRTCAVELAFLKDETDTMRIEENVVISALKNAKNTCKEELKILGVEIKIPETPFPELRFPELYEILKSMGKKIKDGEELDAEAEKLIWEYVKKKYKTDFYFFNRFPSVIKPFYVMRVDEDPTYARSVDLNCRGLELSSGGQREHRYEKIISQAKETGADLKGLEWFTKFFKYGAPPHGGFALGIERLTQVILGIDNIRKTVLFPRAPDRLLP